MTVYVCSNRPRPSVQTGGKGHQWWRRDVFHIKSGTKTLCGRDATDWLVMTGTSDETGASDNLCVRCAKMNRLAKAQTPKST